MSDLYNENTGELVREVTCKITSVLNDNKYHIEFNGETFEGIAKDTSKKFELGDKVVVLIPTEESEDKVNYILRKSDEEEIDISESILEEEDKIDTTYLEKRYVSIKDYYKYFSGNTNSINITNNSNNSSIFCIDKEINKEINGYLSQQYNKIKFSCEIKAEETDNNFNYKEFYGITLVLPCLDSDKNSIEKEVMINSDNLYGNPYKLNDYSYQYSYFTFDENLKLDETKSIILKSYSENFNNNQYNIDIKNIQFSIGFDSISGINQYKLYIADNDVGKPDLINLKPELYLDGKKVETFENKKIFWCIEDFSINPESKFYLKNAGDGWCCINDYETSNNKIYYKSKFSYEIYNNSNNKVKCLIEDFNGKLLASNIYDNDLDNSTDFKVYINNCKHNIIPKDSGKITIIVEPLKEKSSLDITINRYDKNNKYIENSFTKMKKASIFNNIYFYELDSSCIDSKNTFKISIKRRHSILDSLISSKEENNLNILLNKELVLNVENNLMYKLEITNLDGSIHSVNYKYDSDNKSPMTSGYKGNSSFISEENRNINITYKLFDYDNKEINSDNLTQTWIIKNDLIKQISESNAEKIFTYTLNDDKDKEFTFKKSKQPSILLSVVYNGQEITKEANIYFCKEDECGTYGNSINVAVVPSNDYSYLESINDLSVNREQLTLAYYNSKLYYYSSLKNRFISEDEGKVRFYPIIWDNHKIVNPSNYEIKSIEVIDYYNENKDTMKKNANYTNSCIILDKFKDEYNGFTLTINKNNLPKLTKDLRIPSAIPYTTLEKVGEGKKLYKATYIEYPPEDMPWEETKEYVYYRRVDQYKDNSTDKYIIAENRLMELPCYQDENVNLIKIKINYNSKNYEYICPVNFWMSDIHPDLLPKYICYNESKEKEKGKYIYNIDESLEEVKQNLFNYKNNNNNKLNYDLAKYTYEYQNIISDFWEYKKYLYTSLHKDLSIDTISTRYLNEDNKDKEKTKGKFKEIAIGVTNKNNENTDKIESIKTNYTKKINEINNIKIPNYNNQLANFKEFCNHLCLKSWIDTLEEINNSVIAKNEMEFHITNIQNKINNLQNYLETNEQFENDKTYLYELNKEFIDKVEKIYAILQKDFISSEQPEEDFENLNDLSDIDYQWKQHEPDILSKYGIEITSILKQHIDWINESLILYRYFYNIFINFEHKNYLTKYKGVVDGLQKANAFLYNIGRYNKIYNAIDEATKNYESHIRLDRLYDFIKNLYSNYLQYICDIDENSNISISDKEASRYTKLLKELKDDENYYTDALNYCDRLLKKEIDYNMARYISSVNIENLEEEK